jgi:hypothetical protein
MRGQILVCIAVIVFSPTFALALCTNNGATVVYVNGITTAYSDAQNDLLHLEKIFIQNGGDKNVSFKNGYNPSHLDGIGDELESISQAFNAPISDYDLDTILTQIAPEVTTRKILLVGHSQGTFYTNEMYDYLVQNGVPPQSIAVYNLATPASNVAGGGNYLTSANDKVINYVRELDAEANAPQALSANIIIPEELGYANSVWGGHVPEVYLDGAPQRIVSDIQNALGKLSVSEANDSDSLPAQAGCFTPPQLGLLYDAQKTTFAIADPAVTSVDLAAFEAKSTIASVTDNANDILHSAFSDVVFSIIPKPTVQNAASVFAVEKALYGSSLSVADYEALAQGENIPEVQTPAARAPSQVPGAIAPPPQTPPQPTSTPQQKTSASSTPSQPVSTERAPVPVSPGFGGGGAPVIAANVATLIPSNISSDTNGSSSLPDQVPDQTISTTTDTSENGPQPAATTTSPTSIIPPADEATSSTTSVAVVPEAAPTASPVTDTFDPGSSGWNNYLPGWSSASWDTTASDCYAGNCLSETTYNQQYENVKYGTPLTSGSFVIYFRNDGYGGEFGVGVCTTSSSSECESSSSFGGTNALLFIFPIHYWDYTWHYVYFAFRDGPQNKEFCGLVDDDAPADCTWQTAFNPSGTTYSGVVLFTANGLNAGTSFYWDELGTTPYSPTGL